MANKILSNYDKSKLSHEQLKSTLLADAVMEYAGALVVVLDYEGRIVRFNRACEELSCYTFGEVEGKFPWDTVLPPEEAEGIRMNAFEALANNPEALSGSYTNEWLSKSGQRSLIDWSNTLLINESGKMEYMVSIGVNVTERRRVEEEVRASNQVVSAVLDTTPVLIAYLDPEFNFIRVNKSYAMADEKEPEYFMGMNHFELFPNAENEAIFRRVVETGEAHTARAKPFEYEHNPERGVSHWDWTLTPIKDADNKVTGLVLSLLDVTERVEALEVITRREQELEREKESLESRIAERTAELGDALSLNQQMLSSLAVGVAAYRSSGECVFANDALQHVIHGTSEEIMAQNFRRIHTWKKYGLLPMAEKALERGVNIWGEFQITTSFGRELWVDVTFAKFDRAGEPHLLVLASDITSRKEAEQEIISARDEAEKANEAKDVFLSRMSHELRTPMNAILGFTQMLKLEDLKHNQYEFVDEILNAGYHLLELINELLDLSRIVSGNLTITMQLVTLNSVVTEAAKLAEKELKENDIELINKCQKGLELETDPTRLRQVIVNLLTNAAKYNRKGGSVTMGCELKDNDMLRLTVTDTGSGIAEDQLDKLFMPFERLGAEFKKVEGTGIGLALSKQLIEHMGGRIGVDSTLDVGSCFWVELPLGEKLI